MNCKYFFDSLTPSICIYSIGLSEYYSIKLNILTYFKLRYLIRWKDSESTFSIFFS